MQKESLKAKKARADKLIKVLLSLYEDACCSLTYSDPLQLLVATQLAAKCTDARVNIITKDLFKKYKDARDFAGANLEELEQDIKSTGFFHNKARNIKACCQMLVDKYDGKVPDTMDELISLPGVGRKTANVILGDIFKKPGVVVDTHAKRLSRRLGLTDKEDPEKIEYELMKIIPREYWTFFGHSLVYHGRACCKAIKPRCGDCPLAENCPGTGVKQ